MGYQGYKQTFVTSQDLMLVRMKRTIFWDVVQCSLAETEISHMMVVFILLYFYPIGGQALLK
jgi:hypothetical protein